MGQVECSDVQELGCLNNLNVKIEVEVFCFVLLDNLAIERLVHNDVWNLASDHEAADQHQATQLSFVDQDPGKDADPDY